MSLFASSKLSSSPSSVRNTRSLSGNMWGALLSLRGYVRHWFSTTSSSPGSSSESDSGACPVLTSNPSSVSVIFCLNPDGSLWSSVGIWFPTGWILVSSYRSLSVDLEVTIFFSDSQLVIVFSSMKTMSLLRGTFFSAKSHGR